MLRLLLRIFSAIWLANSGFHKLASAAGLCLSKIMLIRLPAWSIAVVQEGNFCIQLTHTDKT